LQPKGIRTIYGDITLTYKEWLAWFKWGFNYFWIPEMLPEDAYWKRDKLGKWENLRKLVTAWHS
jgi:hypothetical protein